MKFQVDKELYPFENNFLEISNGSELHYIDEGSGSVILMLHGNPTWSFLYRKMIIKMKENYRCIAPDYPGFGLSDASKNYDFLPISHTASICEFVEKLKLTDFVLVMQDWGGPIGLSLAEKFSERIRGMVIGNTWAWPLKGNLRFAAFSWLMGGPIGQRLSHPVFGFYSQIRLGSKRHDMG